MTDVPHKPEQLAEPFNKPLEAFGTNVPQIATVVAVVIGSLQFEPYFNAGTWTVVAVLSFAFIHLYRRHIPPHLLKTTAGVVAFILLASIPVWLFAQSFQARTGFFTWLHSNSSLSSAYASLVVSTAVAVLIVSYQNQERMHGMIFPKRLEQAILDQLGSTAFYKENVTYETIVETLSTESVVMVNTMTYRVTNRSSEEAYWGLQYTIQDPEGEVLEAKFNDAVLDHSNPDYQSGRGINIPCLLPPGKAGEVYCRVRQTFRIPDSEFYTSYTPATDLKLIVRNMPGELKFNIESLYRWQPGQTRAENELVVVLDRGVLPFQGVRLHWRM